MHDAEYTAKCIPDITVAMSVSNENLLRAQKFVKSLSFYTLNAIETPVGHTQCMERRHFHFTYHGPYAMYGMMSFHFTYHGPYTMYGTCHFHFTYHGPYAMYGTRHFHFTYSHFHFTYRSFPLYLPRAIRNVWNTSFPLYLPRFHTSSVGRRICPNHRY